MEIDKTELIDALAETVGEQKAEQVVTNAASEVGFGRARSLDESEALEMLTWLSDDDEADSLVRVSANTVKTQIKAGSLA